LAESKGIFVDQIDEETKAWLDSLQKKHAGPALKVFTELEDKKIWAAYKIVSQEILAKELGCCIHVLRRRYRELETKYKGMTKGEK